MTAADQSTSAEPEQRRLVLTIDVPDGPDNDRLAIEALMDLVRHFEYDAVYPTYMRLELGPAPQNG
jgi:hypothetical protein